eukprot:2169270-Karenia_brevis.AAC.1
MDVGLFEAIKGLQIALLGPIKASRGPHPKWMRAFGGHVRSQEGPPGVLHSLKRPASKMDAGLLRPCKAPRMLMMMMMMMMMVMMMMM